MCNNVNDRWQNRIVHTTATSHARNEARNKHGCPSCTTAAAKRDISLEGVPRQLPLQDPNRTRETSNPRHHQPSVRGFTQQGHQYLQHLPTQNPHLIHDQRSRFQFSGLIPPGQWRSSKPPETGYLETF